MPAYEALEIANDHFYLGCRTPFFGNTVYRLLFPPFPPPFLLFHHPSTSHLFFFLFCTEAIVSTCSSHRHSYHLFCFITTASGLFIFAFTTHLKTEQREEGNECMGFSWSVRLGNFSCRKHKKNECESVIESMRDK